MDENINIPIGQFKQLIYEIVDERIKKYIKNYGETVYDGEIVGNLIDLGFGKINLSEVPNKSGEEIVSGDKVRVYAKNDSLSNAYIGIKLGVQNEQHEKN